MTCLTKLDELSPHQFAQAFEATGKKNPDILSDEKVQRDHGKSKEWPAEALKENRQLEKEGAWTECLKLEAN